MKRIFFKSKVNIIFIFIPFVFIIVGILSTFTIGLFLFSHYNSIYENEWKDKLLSRTETFYIQIQQTLNKEENQLPVSYIEDTEDVRPTVSIPSVVYDKNGNSIGYYGSERRDYISLDKMSSYFIYSLLASEDRRFFKHFGVDLKRSVGVAIMIGLFGDTSRGGGSSITQQLSRYIMDWNEVSIERKAVEILGALDLEKRYSKKQILEMYCNYVPFSHGAYGVENASQTFYGKSASELDIAESALLVGVIPNPLKFSPFKSDPEELQIAKERHKRVLYSIVETGFIKEMDTIEEADTIYENFWNNTNFDKLKASSGFNIRFEPAVAYVGEQVRRELIDMGEEYEKLLLEGGGLSIYTTIDLEYERISQKILKEEINLYRQDIQLNHYEEMKENIAEWKKLVQNPGIDKNKLDSIEMEVTDEEVQKAIDDVQGAMILINNHTGEIISFVGGESFSTNNQLIRTHQTKRQPGSSFKPLLYYSALDTKKVGMYTKFEGPYKMVINYEKDKEWVVTNFSRYHDFVGEDRISLSEALYRSVNTIAATLIRDLGIEPIRKNIIRILDMDENEALSRFPDGRLSISLGTSEMSLLEMVTIYSTFARLGKGIKPYLISKIYDHKGSLIIDNESDAKRYSEKQVLNEKTTYILTRIMHEVFTRGTASFLRKLSFVPEIINKETFDNILNSFKYNKDKKVKQITDEEKDLILEYYELDEEKSVYKLKKDKYKEYTDKLKKKYSHRREDYWKKYDKVREILRDITYNREMKGWYIAKTGTTQGNIDSWLCGANSKYSMVVWVGNDNNYKLMRTGAAGAGPIWGRIMSEIEKLEKDDVSDPIKSNNIKIYHYNYRDGLNIDLTNSYNYYDLLNIPVSRETCKIPVKNVTPPYYIDYDAVFYKGTEPGLYDKYNDYHESEEDEDINNPDDNLSIDDLLSDSGDKSINNSNENNSEKEEPDDIEELVSSITEVDVSENENQDDNTINDSSENVDIDEEDNIDEYEDITEQSNEDENNIDQEDDDDNNDDEEDVDDFLQQLIEGDDEEETNNEDDDEDEDDDDDDGLSLSDLIRDDLNHSEPIQTED